MLSKIAKILLMLLLIAPINVERTVPFAEPFFNVCGRAEAFWGQTVELGFDDLYSSVSSRGVVLSDKLRSNEGNSVSMVGFMAPPLTPTINFFVLTREPMSICPFCGSDADWPADIVVVKLDEPVTALPFDSPIKVTGTLELGTEVDAETGFVSLVRIKADNLEAL
jgi:hypothetical protein